MTRPLEQRERGIRFNQLSEGRSAPRRRGIAPYTHIFRFRSGA
jgi:hypothetical protein